MSKEAVEGNFKVQCQRGSCSIDDDKKLKIKIDKHEVVTITTTFTTKAYDTAWSDAENLSFNDNTDPDLVSVTGNLKETPSRSFTIQPVASEDRKKRVNCVIDSSHGMRSAGAMASDDDGGVWDGEDE